MQLCHGYVVLVGVLAASASQEDSPVVHLGQGGVRGSRMTSTDGNPIFAFQGIPYAEPPVGKLRFQRPVEKARWSGTLEATKRTKCTQVSEFGSDSGTLTGDEDCLHLNVYTRNVSTDDDKAVMVFIHGGGFCVGDATTDFYGPERLLNEDIVLVTVNYRLGPLGFLSLGDETLAPNVGLWDQHLALTWVQKNIKAFGGNPKKVTLFGESAGSMSTMIHVLSPRSKGLFNAAIAQSGMANNHFMATDKNPSFYARTLAGLLGCDPSASNGAIRDCLLQVDARPLMRAATKFTKFGILPHYFKPIVDDFVKEPFLPKEPSELIEAGTFNHVPLIIGCNKDEGAILGDTFSPGSDEERFLVDDWKASMALLLFGRDADEVSAAEEAIIDDVLQKDFGGKRPSRGQDYTDNLNAVYGDSEYFVMTVITAAQLAAKSQQPVFHYLYAHHGSVSLTDFIAQPPWKIIARMVGRFFGLDLFKHGQGVCHADELFLLFKAGSLPFDSIYDDNDRRVSSHLIKLWTNFAKTGNPTPDPGQLGNVKWDRVDPENPELMLIQEKLQFGPLSADQTARVQRWSDYWKEVPPRMHLKRSKTWSNPKMYDRDLVIGQTVGREEL